MTIKNYCVASLMMLFLTACIPERVVPPPEIYTLSPQWDNNEHPNTRHDKKAEIIKLAQPIDKTK